MKIQIHELHWRLMSRNNKVLAHSEQYSTPSKCRRAGLKVAKGLGIEHEVARK
jgi:uncharacterized protein YegP (UPF0339 family)